MTEMLLVLSPGDRLWPLSVILTIKQVTVLVRLPCPPAPPVRASERDWSFSGRFSGRLHPISYRNTQNL